MNDETPPFADPYFQFRRQNFTDSAKQTVIPDSQKSTGDYAKDQASSTYDKAAGALQPGTCFLWPLPLSLNDL